MQTAQRPLLRALFLNGLFSAASAVFLFLTADWVTLQLGLASAAPVHLVAAGLVLFALQLLWIVHTRRIRAWEVRTIIAGDVAWVAASIVLVALFHETITSTGLVMIDVVALAVSVFAVMQFWALRYFQQLA